ncbi:hypothetical protein EYF80_064589 [Liparis tanakae]|uniref:Uncharacterized protein n=1 Tax=Liparis tanakae TaxID=230148 RepID=A0A4Z2E9B8_9TELE|nr:hypothetical protein EYF80_064589 [Liparis tanakae]
MEIILKMKIEEEGEKCVPKQRRRVALRTPECYVMLGPRSLRCLHNTEQLQAAALAEERPAADSSPSSHQQVVISGRDRTVLLNDTEHQADFKSHQWFGATVRSHGDTILVRRPSQR